MFCPGDLSVSLSRICDLQRSTSTCRACSPCPATRPPPSRTLPAWRRDVPAAWGCRRVTATPPVKTGTCPAQTSASPSACRLAPGPRCPGGPRRRPSTWRPTSRSRLRTHPPKSCQGQTLKLKGPRCRAPGIEPGLSPLVLAPGMNL